MTLSKTIDKLEKGRAEFAYKCVVEVNSLNPKNEGVAKFLVEKFFQDFKNKVRNKMENELKAKKITEARINQILNNPLNYWKDNSLNEAEKKVLSFWESLRKDYKSYSRRIPQMILSNGLGQTLAFIKSKSKETNAYKLIYTHLTAYMKSEVTTMISMPQEISDLTEWVISMESPKYKHANQEILAFLNWLRRFAEGMIEGE